MIGNILTSNYKYNALKESIYLDLYSTQTLREGRYSLREGRYISSKSSLNLVLEKHSRILRENSEDYESVIILELARNIYRKNPELTLEEALDLSEGFFDSVVKKLGQAANKIGKTFATLASDADIEVLAKTVNLDAEYENLIKDTGDRLSSKFLRDLEKMTSDADGPNPSTFPLSNKKSAFFQGVIDIAAFYDSLAADLKENPERASMYNEIVQDLRTAIDKWINDVKTKDGGTYAYFGGGDASKSVRKNEQRESEFYRSQTGGTEDSEKALGQARQSGALAYSTARGKDHKDVNFLSIKKPLVVAIAGVLAAYLGAELAKDAAEAVADNIFLDKELMGSAKSVEELRADPPSLDLFKGNLVSNVMDTFGTYEVQPGEAVINILDNVSGGEFGLGDNPTVGELRDFLISRGGGDFEAGVQDISQYFARPDDAADILMRAQEGGDATVWGNVFTSAESADYTIHPEKIIPTAGRAQVLAVVARFLAQAAARGVLRNVAVAGVTQAAAATGATQAATAAGVSASAIAAPILAFLGAGAVVSGATVAGLRLYAKKNSRLATLNQLSKLIQPFEEIQSPPPKQKRAKPARKKAQPPGPSDSGQVAAPTTQDSTRPRPRSPLTRNVQTYSRSGIRNLQ